MKEDSNSNKLEKQDVAQVSGGADIDSAPMQSCPYCMAETGSVVWMDCVGTWSKGNWGVWTSGYDYKCPVCGQKIQVQE